MKKEVKIGLIIVGLVLLVTVVLFLKSCNKKESKLNTNSTTTKKVVGDKVLSDNSVIVKYTSDKEIKEDYKLVAKKVQDNFDFADLIGVYDIDIMDKNNNVVKIDDTLLEISVPYTNDLKYTNFKVLYLDVNNEVKQTISAKYSNQMITFKVNHLSRYAIVGYKEENTTTTTTEVIESTTKRFNKKTTNRATTKNSNNAVSETTTEATTKKSETTTSSTTTKKVKTYSYKWTNNCDSVNQCYLLIVDENGDAINGTITVTYTDFNKSVTENVSTNGILLPKDVVVISNVKGN